MLGVLARGVATRGTRSAAEQPGHRDDLGDLLAACSAVVPRPARGAHLGDRIGAVLDELLDVVGADREARTHDHTATPHPTLDDASSKVGWGVAV